MIRRSPELVIAGYFLSRCGDQKTKPGNVFPPSVLGTTDWKNAYAMFFEELHGGRMLRSFCNTLKNSRDAFDAWIDSGRIGWRSSSQAREPRALGGIEQSVFDTWMQRSDEELWNHVRPFADMGVNRVSSQVLNDLESELELGEEFRTRTEGGKRVFISTRVERDPRLRNDAIAIHGARCVVCKFDFGAVYGDWGSGFVEVHHLQPLGDEGNRRETDPSLDLTVVCANCHRMMHRRRSNVLEIAELRQKLDLVALKSWAASLELDVE